MKLSSQANNVRGKQFFIVLYLYHCMAIDLHSNCPRNENKIQEQKQIQSRLVLRLEVNLK